MKKTVVLICTHNGAEFIVEQLESIACQTTPVNEIYLHDYNSSDDTVVKVENFQDKCQIPIHLMQLKTANGPASSFLNSLAYLRDTLSDETIIHIADQDDYWFATKNAIVLEKFNANIELSMAFHDVIIADSGLQMIRPSFYGEYYNVFRDFKFPSQNYSNCVIGHTISIKLETLSMLSLVFEQGVPMHDWYLVNQVLAKGLRYEFIGQPLSLYRQHSNNILGANRVKALSSTQYMRHHGNKLRAYLRLQLDKGLMVNSNHYVTVIFNIWPLKKKFFILLSLLLSRKLSG
jgi:rhamnosyltransferase